MGPKYSLIKHGLKFSGGSLNFEADFPQKVSLKILNSAACSSFCDLFSDCLKTINYLNMNLLIFCRHTAGFKKEFQKFRILNKNSPMIKGLYSMWLFLFQGGIKAVVWTDAFQILIITVGMVALLIKGVLEVGSIELVIQRVKDGGRMPYFE